VSLLSWVLVLAAVGWSVLFVSMGVLALSMRHSKRWVAVLINTLATVVLFYGLYRAFAFAFTLARNGISLSPRPDHATLVLGEGGMSVITFALGTLATLAFAMWRQERDAIRRHVRQARDLANDCYAQLCRLSDVQEAGGPDVTGESRAVDRICTEAYRPRFAYSLGRLRSHRSCDRLVELGLDLERNLFGLAVMQRSPGESAIPMAITDRLRQVEPTLRSFIDEASRLRKRH